jgi:hypothetical protein
MAAASTDTSSAIAEFSVSLLQNPDAFIFQLNNVLQFLASEIAYLEGASGPITIKATVTGPGFFDQDDSVPTDPDELLTLGAAETLFGSSKQLSFTSLSQNPVPPGGTGSTGSDTGVTFDGVVVTY